VAFAPWIRDKALMYNTRAYLWNVTEAQFEVTGVIGLISLLVMLLIVFFPTQAVPRFLLQQQSQTVQFGPQCMIVTQVQIW
jgi:hypothetical protein